MKTVIKISLIFFINWVFGQAKAQRTEGLLQEGKIDIMSNLNAKNDTLFHSSKQLDSLIQVDSFVVRRLYDTLYYTTYKKENKKYYYKMFYYPDGKKYQEVYLDNNKDSSVCWYESGKLKGISYLNGKNREFTTWYEDGQLESIQKMYGDSGIGKSWYSNKQLKSETRLGANGGVDGYDREWCENGQLIRQKMINRGKYREISFWCDGTIKSDLTYINVPWLLTGKLTAWYENGLKMLENYYKESENMEEAGIRTGHWKYWDEEGNLIKEETYEDNKLIKIKEFVPMNKKMRE